jgi:hypothetical protein
VTAGGITRRAWLSAAALSACSKPPARVSAQYSVAAVREAGRPETPPEVRVHGGWPAFAVSPGEEGGPVLSWTQRHNEPSRFRVTVALDDREVKLVDAVLARSGRTLATLDLRSACALQPFEAVLDAGATSAASSEGIRLRLREGTTPLWLHGGDPVPTGLRPHLMLTGQDGPLTEFHRRLRSLDSVQPFGWMHGCVLDGLGDLQAGEALNEHLSRYFLPGGRLSFEDLRSRAAEGRLAGIESTLPFAALARVEPRHPALDIAIEFWKKTQDAEGCIMDGTTTSAEGSYTVAYPLAVAGRRRHEPALEQMALRQLRIRRARLVADGALFLRHHKDQPRTFRNWARGVAWYSLGLVRTLAELHDRPGVDDLRAEAKRAAAWAMERQAADGLWHCFVDEPQVAPDTGGSAGIAAALAIGARHGILDAAAREAAERTLRGLVPNLTPDGFLSGVAHSNRGGEELQRSDYRVILQFGMGLMGQLIAALDA